MRNKIISLLLISAVSVFSMSACGGRNEDKTDNNTGNSVTEDMKDIGNDMTDTADDALKKTEDTIEKGMNSMEDAMNGENNKAE